MAKRYGIVFCIFCVISLILIGELICRDASEEGYPEERQRESDFVYGEIIAIDGASNSFVVKYFNYDTMDDRTVEIRLGDETEWEDVTGIMALHVGDWIGSHYYISDDGTNVADSVRLEKEIVIEGT